MQKLLTTKQAADILGLKPNTLEIWRIHRRGPNFKKIGRRVLYDPADLELFSQHCTVETDNSIPARHADIARTLKGHKAP